ncbi:MAG: ATP/GTP-binding protein [Burkholderiaceae bacterium]|jgi:signal recognition particle receptor subunit beta|nr:ATP/GTP-binding protein [Burkholderiaceae bacterium]
MNTYRIVFAGPIGAGKTTAIGALSDVPPVTTEVASDEAVAAGKQTTTVAFDYGQVLLDSGDVVQLYGTPGQARFDFMWPIIADNALGAIILADNSRADSIALTLDYVREFAPRIVAGNCIVGVGRTETHPVPTVDDYADALSAAGFDLPVMAIDARSREHALLLLDVLLARLEAVRDVQ